ncbi:MAG: hypothetical protein K0R61_2457 [Microvirga sp.]|nr:hypothetical protein [Microvirga sp.]
MPGHRFEIGESVIYSERRFPAAIWTAELIVIEQITRGGEPVYHLRDSRGTDEYVLGEHELSPPPDSHDRKHLGRCASEAGRVCARGRGAS